ncbi:hypothetical protein BYT27DRAFT_7209620 [Phlegmacium glaucopus]|nr:hypothetical protein BYT27DRAFT_7209620 [Phlegmacium glaucopus]
MSKKHWRGPPESYVQGRLNILVVFISLVSLTSSAQKIKYGEHDLAIKAKLQTLIVNTWIKNIWGLNEPPARVSSVKMLYDVRAVLATNRRKRKCDVNRVGELASQLTLLQATDASYTLMFTELQHIAPTIAEYLPLPAGWNHAQPTTMLPSPPSISSLAPVMMRRYETSDKSSDESSDDSDWAWMMKGENEMEVEEIREQKCEDEGK